MAAGAQQLKHAIIRKQARLDQVTDAQQERMQQLLQEELDLDAYIDNPEEECQRVAEVMAVRMAEEFGRVTKLANTFADDVEGLQ